MHSESKSVATFREVTETGGERVSRAQLDRCIQRYFWAAQYCRGKDILELACGTAPGLGLIAATACSVVGSDISESNLKIARRTYRDRLTLVRCDATSTPFPDEAFDVVIMFEAIYYLSDIDAFIEEAFRLLRPGGVLLLATANKDLTDFNPSLYSKQYLNLPELHVKLSAQGFATEYFAGSPVSESVTGRALRVIKRMAVNRGIMPRTMRGKRFLKRLLFGPLVTLPRELELSFAATRFIAPVRLHGPEVDLTHQVLYCAARKSSL